MFASAPIGAVNAIDLQPDGLHAGPCYPPSMRPVLAASLASALLACTGCHSAYVAATVSNHTQQPISVIEVDYPSASFGTQNLPPGQDFHYRFKVQGTGPTKLLWTDAQFHDQKSSGPILHEHDEGTLLIDLTPAGPVWTPALHNPLTH